MIMVWFNILKESRLTSQTGINTKLGTKPLTITDNDDEPSCCEIAVDAYEDVIAEYSHMDKTKIERDWAKWAWEKYIITLKTTGSYNTWTVQEHLEHRKGGLTELTCDAMWFQLEQDIRDTGESNDNPLARETGEILQKIHEKLKQIRRDWSDCETRPSWRK